MSTAPALLFIQYGGYTPDNIVIDTITLDSIVLTPMNVVSQIASDDQYHYGFNGQMKVNEWAGVGNHLDFGARGLDTRLGRWFSVDPLQANYPSWSAYNFTMDNPILFIDPDGKVVTVKDVSSYKAILGTLTEREIKRININKDGVIAILGKDIGSTNLQNLRTLVDSKTNHNFITENTYKSADGDVTLPDNVYGRTLFPESENDVGLSKTNISPDKDVYVILKPNTEEGLVSLVAHEGFGHAVLGERKRKGAKVSLYHDFGPTGEKNEDFKKQGWGAVGEAKENYKCNTESAELKQFLDEKAKEVENTTKQEPKQQ
jgi:RHS repeat-associated protein